MNFTETSLFIMNMLNKTMKKEIKDFIKNVKKVKMSYSQSAISKARLKITPNLFKELNREFIEDIYEDKEEIKLYKNFRILGIDGTKIELPNMIIAKDEKQSRDIKKIYGEGTNGHGKYGARGLVSIMYDLENNFVLDSVLTSINSSEGFMAVEHIEELLKLKKDVKEKYNDLLIYDRGYPSFGLISMHYKHNLDFIMRVNSKSFKAIQSFQRSKKNDEILEIEVTSGILRSLSNNKKHSSLKEIRKELKIGDKIKVRAIKVVLKNGDIETILTSLLSQDIYKTEMFKEFYFKRWKVEIAYDILKNIFDIENFSGLTQIAINQDFFAIILTNNICSLIMSDVMEEKVILYNQEKERKYFYQLNKKFSIGCMKDKLISMLIKNAHTSKIYNMIEAEIMASLLPIKPDRSFPRNRVSTTKFHPSKKNGF